MIKLRNVLLKKDIDKNSFNYIVSRLSYASFVNEQNTLLYIATPKAACSTMKHIFLDLDGKTMPFIHVNKETSLKMAVHNRKLNPVQSLKEISYKKIEHILYSDEVVRFCIVRNPYARIASAWSDKIRQKEPAFIDICKDINDFNHRKKGLNECPSFEDFVNWVVSTNYINRCNVHWRSLNALLLPEVINYTHVLRTESLENDFQKILDIVNPNSSAIKYLDKFKINESLPIEWKELFTEKTAKQVYEFYKEDFLFYNYDQDSWKLTDTIELTKDEQMKILKFKINKLEKIALEAIRNRNEVISHFCKRPNNKILEI